MNFKTTILALAILAFTSQALSQSDITIRLYNQITDETELRSFLAQELEKEVYKKENFDEQYINDLIDSVNSGFDESEREIETFIVKQKNNTQGFIITGLHTDKNDHSSFIIFMIAGCMKNSPALLQHAVTHLSSKANVVVLFNGLSQEHQEIFKSMGFTLAESLFGLEFYEMSN